MAKRTRCALCLTYTDCDCKAGSWPVKARLRVASQWEGGPFLHPADEEGESKSE